MRSIDEFGDVKSSRFELLGCGARDCCVWGGGAELKDLAGAGWSQQILRQQLF